MGAPVDSASRTPLGISRLQKGVQLKYFDLGYSRYDRRASAFRSNWMPNVS